MRALAAPCSPAWCRSRGRWSPGRDRCRAALIRFNFLDQPGLIDFLAASSWCWSRCASRADTSRGETQTFSFAPKVRADPERLRADLVGPPDRPRSAWPCSSWSPSCCRSSSPQPSRQLLYATILALRDLCALSLTVLTGWAGQLSLGQMAFAGFGALLAAALRAAHVDTALATSTCWSSGIDRCRSAVAARSPRSSPPGWRRHRARRAPRARPPARRHTFAFAVAAQQYLYRQADLQRRPPELGAVPRGTCSASTSRRSARTTTSARRARVPGPRRPAAPHGVGRSTIAVRDNPDTRRRLHGRRRPRRS